MSAHSIRHPIRLSRRPYPAYRVDAYATAATKPIGEINTTPLIDVMLVLLALLIMTVPIATHQTQVDLPADGGEVVLTQEPVALTVDAGGQAFWNGTALDDTALRQHLSAAAALPEQPVIRFQPDPSASYDAAVHVIAMAGEVGVENLAFIGNEQFGTFGR